jgi:cystathionine beta-lyase
VAAWCAARPEVVQVLHPALPGSPGHAQWQALCITDLAAGLFSIILDARYTIEQVDVFCDALQLFKLGYSWGGPTSLVVPYNIASMRGGDWPAALKSGHLVRFSIGFEAVTDLQDDLAQAFTKAFSKPSF